MTAKLEAEDREWARERAAANHSHKAFSLYLAHRSAQQAKTHLRAADYYAEGAFTEELGRIDRLIRRLGDRLRKVMTSPWQNRRLDEPPAH